MLQRHSGAKKLLYGASEVMNAAQFLKQASSGITGVCLALINFLIGYTKGHACYITQVVSRFVSMFSCACHGITPFFPRSPQNTCLPGFQPIRFPALATGYT